MTAKLGSGDYLYEELEDWAQLPDGAHPGEEPGLFTTPHGLAVDSRGDLYVAEVSWSAYGRLLDPPREARCFRKLVRAG